MGMSNEQQTNIGIQKSRNMRHLPDVRGYNDDTEVGMGSNMEETKVDESAIKLFTSSLKNIRKSHSTTNDVSNTINTEPSLSSSVLSLNKDLVNDAPDNTSPFNSYYSVGNGQTRFPYYDPLDIGSHKKVVISNSPHSSCGSKASNSPQKSPVRGILKKRNVPSNSSSEGVEPYRLSKSEGDLTNSPASSIGTRPPSMLSDITFSRIPHPELSPSWKSAFSAVKPRQNNGKKSEGPVVAIHPTNTDEKQSLQMQVTPRTIGGLPLNIQPMPYTSINQHLISDAHPVEHSQIQRTSPGKNTKHKKTNKSQLLDKSSSKSANNSKQMQNTDNQLPPTEVISNEATRIRSLIADMTSEQVKEDILGKIDSKDPNIINSLMKLFPASKFISKAHCVRCHKDYNPNERGRCMLSHPERMVAKIGQDDMGADFVCGCCNVAFRLIKMDFYEESTNAILTGHCYSGLHTSDPGSVDYRISGGAAKTCQEHGCVEFYV